MMSEVPASNSTPPPRRLQFSTATLLGTMTLLAVAMAILTALPGRGATLLATTLLIAAVAFLVAGAIYARGNARAFCIGAIAAQLLTGTNITQLIWSIGNHYGGEQPWLGTLILAGDAVPLQLAAMLLAGGVCVAGRRFWRGPTTSKTCNSDIEPQSAE